MSGSPPIGAERRDTRHPDYDALMLRGLFVWLVAVPVPIMGLIWTFFFV